MHDTSWSMLRQRLLLSGAGIFAIAHGLQSLTTRDDLTTILTIAFSSEAFAGAAALASVAAGIIGDRRSRDPRKH